MLSPNGWRTNGNTDPLRTQNRPNLKDNKGAKMNPELFSEIKKLWDKKIPLDPKNLAECLKLIGVSIPTEKLPKLLPAIQTGFIYWNGGFRNFSPVLSEVITKLLEGRPAQTLLDPWAGWGTMLEVARRATSPSRCLAFSPDPADPEVRLEFDPDAPEDELEFNPDAVEIELARAFFPEVEWKIGKPLSLLNEHKGPIDIVVNCLPLVSKSSESLELTGIEGKPLKLRDELANIILASATARLSADGIGLFIVSDRFFFSKESVFRKFPELGFNIEAALALPGGSLSPYGPIDTVLLVVNKVANQKMFVAELSTDRKTNSQILTNFRNREEGGALELGRYIDVLEFRSIDSLRAGENIESARKNFGFPAVELEDLATEINLGRRGDDLNFPTAANALYIPMIGQSEVVDSIEELTLKAQNYAQVVVDPSRSQATFITQFLNSELGKKIREWGTSGTTIQRLNKKALSKLQVFIPDLATQRLMLEIEARITAEENTLLNLQNELSDLRRDLWRNPRSANSVDQRVSKFSTRMSANLKEQASIGLDQWFETIPFPLASILRAWRATSSDDYKTKVEHLLHFFEATAQFISVIFLSAFSKNEGLFEPHKLKLKKAMKRHNLSYQRATFGTWKLVVEYLGKQTRLLLQEKVENGRRICADIFSDDTLRLPSLLCSKEIAIVLGVTNKMRNNLRGHGGVLSQVHAKLHNEKLLGEVEKLRGAMSDLWDSSVVVSPLHCRPRRGIFENEIAILKGSNSEFLKEPREMSTWLDVESLYIINGDQKSALKLLPLIRLNASPGTAKNACYFFNRTEPKGARFVSYHFKDQPELSDQFQETTEAIKRLTED